MVLPPADVVWRTERRLNDPDCRDMTSPTSCADTARARYDRSRLGWASQTIDAVCYDSRQGRYLASCDRRYSWGTAKEDYVLPDAHTVLIRLSPERIAEAGAYDCVWSWTPRRPGSRTETTTQSCATPLKITRLPYAVDRNLSGASVQVKLPDGRTLNDPQVVVEDLFIVALGDSFASGESNPDVPVTFSAVREMVYDPTLMREEMATRSTSQVAAETDPRCTGRKFRLQKPAAAQARRRGAGALFPARIGAVRQGVQCRQSALAQPRLPPLAIRLSVSRRAATQFGKSAPVDHAGQPGLYRLRGDRRSVPREEGARGGRQRDGAFPARSTRRSDLQKPRGSHAACDLQSADLCQRQRAGRQYAGDKILVCAE